MSIGERVKHVRELVKLTQQQFANEIEISQGRLSEIEKNKCKPSAETLISLSKKYDINLNWLLLGEGRPNKS
ncbi:helix-turn-helix domain-containing protein [Paenibacillus camelliae]|uniref:helix-turn-helix domain-containing protein n=1 Tax=Paenibacillus camelliae TaxID=512410 RepID=UPI00203B6E2A|nr:helix-turn-helix transcriptional regulator [Paenibacillus camelliae]MCM3634970.1 helix-turn-helix domain-containing protein [Paenibacillus camelliae]